MIATNLIGITGGFQGQRERVLDVITFCIDEMMPRKRTLDIEVKLWNCEKHERALGQCLYHGDNIFEIDIDNKQKLYDLILTTCHEMVHVKQYTRKELTEQYPRSFWYGKEYTDGRCYPWELEAWEMQKPLAHKYIKQHMNGAIKHIKMLDRRS
tara:strand:+ start:154 stop:615 length:462 start_codon:yes stop_codon:yes gene_type:complete